MKSSKPIFLVLALLLAVPAWAQLQVSGPKITLTQGGNDATIGAAGALKINLGELGGTSLTGANVVDGANTAFRVNCVTGCAAGSSFTDNSAFTAGSTAVNVGAGVFNDSIAALTSGNAGAYRLTSDRMVFTNLGKVGGTAIALGQTTMSASLPVVIASNQSAVPASQSGTWTVQPGNTANTTAWLVTGTGGTFPSTQSGTWTVQPGNTANTTPWLVSSVPKTACGSTVFSQALVAVPTTATAVATSTTCVVAIVINNTNSSAGTVTVSDNQGTPINDLLTFSIPALSQLIQPLYGVQFTTGIKWNASGTGFTGAILGYQ